MNYRTITVDQRRYRILPRKPSVIFFQIAGQFLTRCLWLGRITAVIYLDCAWRWVASARVNALSLSDSPSAALWRSGYLWLRLE
jgi:hypothetical protein